MRLNQDKFLFIILKWKSVISMLHSKEKQLSQYAISKGCKWNEIIEMANAGGIVSIELGQRRVPSEVITALESACTNAEAEHYRMYR